MIIKFGCKGTAFPIYPKGHYCTKSGKKGAFVLKHTQK